MTIVSINDLQSSYKDAIRKDGMIDLVSLPQESTLKIKNLKSYFSNPLWEKSTQSTGHCKLTHKVTKVVVSYQNHGPEAIAPHIQSQILDQTQVHLNILCNQIFKYTSRNWKYEPNYQQALINYRSL